MNKKEREKNQWHSRLLKAKRIICHYCGVSLTPETVTREHLKPSASGGSGAYVNVVFACRKCNSSRSSKDYVTFKLMMLPIKQARRKGYG